MEFLEVFLGYEKRAYISINLYDTVMHRHQMKTKLKNWTIGKCINCDFSGQVIDTDVTNHEFGLCSLCFSAVDNKASQLTLAILGIGKN